MNTCKNCKVDIKPSNKFCSISCANIGVRRHGSARFCAHCKTKTSNPKFCSIQCQMDFQWSAVKQEIESTGSAKSLKGSKRYLIETRGRSCEICKGTTWLDQPIPLVRDHIDGNSDNHLLSNLRLICCNCDAQTPTYKGKNRGNGRAYRRQRYAEGKSY